MNSNDQIFFRQFNSGGVLFIVGEIEAGKQLNDEYNQEMLFSIGARRSETNLFRVETTLYDILSDSVYDNLSDSLLNEMVFELSVEDIKNFFEGTLSYLSSIFKHEEEFGIKIIEPFLECFNNYVDQVMESSGDMTLGIEVKFASGFFECSYFLGIESEEGCTILAEAGLGHAFEVLKNDYEIQDGLDKPENEEEIPTNVNDEPKPTLGDLIREKLYGPLNKH